MRSFGTVKPTFWNGPSGRAIREAGADVQLVALYLLTNPHANMIGLYYLPMVFARKELPLAMPQILKSMQALDALGFASYDTTAEVVWVREMAKFQLGDELKLEDRRVKGIATLYWDVPPNRFLGEFFDRYAEPFHLPRRREFLSPQEGAVTGAVTAPTSVPSPSQSPDQSPVLKKEERARQLITTWNATVVSFALVEAFTPDRIKAAAARLVEKGQSDLDWWVRAITRGEASDFLTGRQPSRDHPHWRADFDWFMKPGRAAKVMEGKYDNKLRLAATGTDGRGRTGSAPGKFANVEEQD